MDSRIAVICVVLAAFAVDQTVGAPQKDPVVSGDAYTTKYDNIDIEQVLASKRLVNSYVQCLLDKKPCTPEGSELRSTYLLNFFFFYSFAEEVTTIILLFLKLLKLMLFFKYKK